MQLEFFKRLVICEHFKDIELTKLSHTSVCYVPRVTIGVHNTPTRKVELSLGIFTDKFFQFYRLYIWDFYHFKLTKDWTK